MLHISAVSRRLTQAHGSYSTWAQRRAEQQLAFARQESLRREEVKELREYAGHGFKYGGSSASIGKMAMKAKQADKLEEEGRRQADELAALQEDVELPLELKSGGRLDGFIVQLLGVAFGYPGSTKPLFEHVEMGIDSASRIVLLGENGNGARRRRRRRRLRLPRLLRPRLPLLRRGPAQLARALAPAAHARAAAAAASVVSSQARRRCPSC